MKKPQRKTKITTWNLGVFRRQVIREYPEHQGPPRQAPPPVKKINLADRLIEAALPGKVRRQQDLKRLEQRFGKQEKERGR